RASMIFLPKFDPDLIIKLMARASVLMGVPTFYTRLLQSPALTKASTRHMRLFVSGSAPLLADTHREWAARTGHAVLERYGMTETNMNTSNPYEGERVAGAVGHPLPGVSVRVTDPETGKELGRESVVIGVPHADFGEGVTAVVVCNKGADVSEASVLKALDGRLAKFKMPKRVFVVDELPRNAMGKVQKNILRDMYSDIYTKAK